jgi:hypothetical protein
MTQSTLTRRGHGGMQALPNPYRPGWHWPLPVCRCCPGAPGLTVVDLDDAAAVAWAPESLPATRVVETTRGEHWIYRGAMPSHNAVRTGVDIESTMSYARSLGHGTGTMTALPNAVRTLAVKEPSPVQIRDSRAARARRRRPIH